jgi:hypothetical protein
MEKRFSEQESLAVISEMIDRARNNVQQGAGRMMVFWGWMVAVVAVANAGLICLLAWQKLPVQGSFWVWTLMVPAWGVAWLMKRKQREATGVKSYADGVIGAVWQSFSVAVGLFLAMVFGLAYGLGEYKCFFVLINPVILLLTGTCEFVVGRACRFGPFVRGAVAMWVGSALCVVSVILADRGEGVLLQFMVLAACMVAGFVVPGRLLNRLGEAGHV